VCDCRRGLDWWMDLLTTNTYEPNYNQLQSCRWSPHFTNVYKLNLLPACYVTNSPSLATASNSGDSSASRAQDVTVRRISHNWTHSAKVKITLLLTVSKSMSWRRAPSGAHDQILAPVWQLLSSPFGVLSLTRGRVCRLSESQHVQYI
jgi:hypothetical protein